VPAAGRPRRLRRGLVALGIAIALPPAFATSPAAAIVIEDPDPDPDPVTMCGVAEPSEDLADCGVGDPPYVPGTVPPFNPPARPFVFAPMPSSGFINSSTWYSCGDVPHVWVGPSNDVTRGTTLYPTGVVVKGTVARFNFYSSSGQLVTSHWTKPAQDNCVIHHEPEAMSTAGLAPGYYFVYASYMSMSPAPYSEDREGFMFAWQGRYISALRIRY